MNALLIYPEFPENHAIFKYTLKFTGKRSALPPLELMTVATLLPKTWRKRLIDTNMQHLKDTDLVWADVVFLNAMQIQSLSLAEIISRCRSCGLRTIVSGPITNNLSYTDLNADHVVIGRSEDLIELIARDIETETAIPVYQSTKEPALQRESLPDMSLINVSRYVMPLIKISS